MLRELADKIQVVLAVNDEHFTPAERNILEQTAVYLEQQQTIIDLLRELGTRRDTARRRKTKKAKPPPSSEPEEPIDPVTRRRRLFWTR